MHFAEINIIRVALALVAGGLLGAGFGLLQNLALRRHQRLQATGELKGTLAVMPGSMRRVAYLLLALVAVQLLCPLLFTDGTQWWVSAGVLGGYGTILVRQLRLRRGGLP